MSRASRGASLEASARFSRPAQIFSSSAWCSASCFSARWARAAWWSSLSERPPPSPSVLATKSARSLGSVPSRSSRCPLLRSFCRLFCSQRSTDSFSSAGSMMLRRPDRACWASWSASCCRSAASATLRSRADCRLWRCSCCSRETSVMACASSRFCTSAWRPSSALKSARSSSPSARRSSPGRLPSCSSSARSCSRTRPASSAMGWSCCCCSSCCRSCSSCCCRSWSWKVCTCRARLSSSESGPAGSWSW
mmetsp:Transcript_86998/g.263824  ORF Transcript_86998/g.263824 Transcript_86998/m.263824 type:complete len:251 (-) Transcript_86998:93-845(-)